MALVRILVDGYSFLHGWPALAPGKPRHSPVAREELINVLTQYHDACGTPITIVFDGAGSKRAAGEPPPSSGIEILYSRANQTADQMIERAASRLKEYGEDEIVAVGGHAAKAAHDVALGEVVRHHPKSQHHGFGSEPRRLRNSACCEA